MSLALTGKGNWTVFTSGSCSVLPKRYFLVALSNLVIDTLIGNRTSCPLIRSAVILVRDKTNQNCEFVNYWYDYRLNRIPLNPISIISFVKLVLIKRLCNKRGHASYSLLYNPRYQ